MTFFKKYYRYPLAYAKEELDIQITLTDFDLFSENTSRKSLNSATVLNIFTKSSSREHSLPLYDARIHLAHVMCKASMNSC